MGWGGRYRGERLSRPVPGHYMKLSGVETYLWTDLRENTHLKLHGTIVVSFNDQWITLNTGGWQTKLTRGRMNWASQNFDLGYSVFMDRGDAFVEFQGYWPFDSDELSLNRQTMGVVKGREVEVHDPLGKFKRQRLRDNNPTRSYAKNITLRDDLDNIDVELDDQGSIILFRLASARAREWWGEHVSEGPMFGARYAVETRYASDIVEGMIGDGLNVR